MKFEWEIMQIETIDNDSFATGRAKVFGGWLVHHFMSINDKPVESMIFIPDLNHEWTID